ncbi:hypothetical protein M1563_05180 [Patescibacteria group bacterium]|nr:hypothetical protein [Patescibacteria group bacterium]
MIDEHFTILGSILVAIGGLSYLIDTVKGRVKPNKVSFLLWSFAPLIAFAAQIKEGVSFLLALITFVAGIEPLMIFIASFFNKKAAWQLRSFDLACGAVSLLGLVLWQITQTGYIAIILSIVADGMASLPTIIKSFTHPETESGWPYFTTVIAAIITLLAAKDYSLASVGFTVYLLIVCSVISALVHFRLGRPLSKAFGLKDVN